MTTTSAGKISCRIVHAQFEYHSILLDLWTIIFGSYEALGREIYLRKPNWKTVTVLLVSDISYLPQLAEAFKTYPIKQHGNILLVGLPTDRVQEVLKTLFGAQIHIDDPRIE